MASIKTIREIMVDAFEYPHMPYWFTIKQAIGIIKKSFLETEKCVRPLAVLVFDEKYNLMGTVALKDIVKGLEPKLLKPQIMTDFSGADIEQALTNYEAAMFSEKAKEQAERQVGEIMVPVKAYVFPDDAVAKAAFLMSHHNLDILPVLDTNQKLVGLVRMLDVFKEISSIVSE